MLADPEVDQPARRNRVRCMRSFAQVLTLYTSVSVSAAVLAILASGLALAIRRRDVSRVHGGLRPAPGPFSPSRRR